MTRRIFVAAIALIYMVLGLLNFYNSLFPTLSSSGLFLLRPFSLVGSALAFYAGLTMFRFNEFGRKLIVILLALRIGMNAWLLFGWSKGDGLAVENRLGEIIYRIESPYAFPGFFVGWILIGLVMIIFLSQKETKEIFVPVEANDAKPDIIFEE